MIVSLDILSLSIIGAFHFESDRSVILIRQLVSCLLPFFFCIATEISEMSTGVIPLILDACPRFIG